MPDLRDALCGIIPPLVTPFDGGEIDWDGYGSLLEHVIDGGVDAVFPCGTTGEGTSLTRQERADLVRRTVDAVPDALPVLAGGTGTAVESTLAWIEELAEVGADGVVLTGPYFHTANAPDGYRRFFEPIAEESDLPILLYNIPGYVGADIPREVVIELADHPNVLGLKDSSGDLGYALSIQNQVDEAFLLLQGFDVLLLASLRMGFDGGVNAGANVDPEAYRHVIDESDRAMGVHRTVISPLFELFQKHGFAAATKAALADRGIVDRPDVRPPLVPVDPAEIGLALAEASETAG